jgi:hypothetical protein
MRTRSSKHSLAPRRGDASPAETFPAEEIQDSLRARIWISLGTLLFSAIWFFTPPSILESYDYIFFYEPNFQFLLDALKEGRLPLWNPYVGLGRPYLADIQNAVFYPPLYLLLVGKEVGVILIVWLHSTLVVFGMLKLRNVFSMKRGVALLVAFTFLASGGVSARLFAGQLLYWAALCYVPLLFWFAARLGEAWRPRLLGLYALTLALQFLCGHPQAFWVSAFGQGIFIITRNLIPWKERGWPLFRSLLQYLVANIWCIALVAVVLLPFLELIKEGNRNLPSAEFVNFGKFVWPQFLSLAHPMSGMLSLDWERILFIGMPMFLAGLAGCFSFRDRNVRALLVTALIAALVGAGDTTPLFSIFYHGLPGYTSFRLHARLGLLVMFAFLCMGGYWLSSPNAPRWVPTRLRAHPRFVWGLFVTLQSMHLLYGAIGMKFGYSAEAVMRGAVDYSLQSKLTTALRERGLLEPGTPPPRVSVPRKLIPPNQAMVNHYAHFDGYTSLFLRRPWQFVHGMAGLPLPEFKNTFVDARIYDRGSFPVPTVALQAGMTVANPEIVFATNVEPRAYIAFDFEVAEDFTNALRKMRQGQDIYQRPLVEKNFSGFQPTALRKSITARIEEFRPNEITIQIDAEQDGLLVLAEAYYPGWIMEAAGRRTQARPVNAWMRAFPITAGRYPVRVFYQQNGLAAGLAISGMGVAALILVFALKGRRISRAPDVLVNPAAQQSD